MSETIGNIRRNKKIELKFFRFLYMLFSKIGRPIYSKHVRIFCKIHVTYLKWHFNEHSFPTFSLFLVRSEILGLLVNTVTAEDEYFYQDRENLPSPIQMQFSKKPNTFCCFFVPFLESKLNFDYFEKNLRLLD